MKNIANWAATAAFIAGLAGVQLYATRLKDQLQGGPPESVLLVTQDLPEGTTLASDHLASIELPSDYLDRRRVRHVDRKKILGTRLDQELKAGDPLFWSDLADGEAHRDLAEVLAPGRRAYQVGPEANPLGRLLQAGDRVDVLLERGGNSELLLERVLVLAVGGRMASDVEPEGSPSPGRGVTLSVSVDEGAELLAAESRGDLRLLLRNPDDDESHEENSEVPTEASVRVVRSQSRKREIEHVR